MMSSRQTLELLHGSYAVSRLTPTAEVPEWARGDVVAIVRTPEELSIVCDQSEVPASLLAGPLVEADWRCLRIAGTLDFQLVGILAQLTTVLAAVGVSVFVFSTFDTDYVLVKQAQLAVALDALERNGYVVAQL